MKRTEGIILLYLFFIGLYTISSIDGVFWDCIYYIGIDAFIIYILIDQLNKSVSKSLVWGAIIVTGEHAFIISSLLARPKAYYDTLTNKNIALLIALTVIVVYIVVSFKERKKWKRLGNG